MLHILQSFEGSHFKAFRERDTVGCLLSISTNHIKAPTDKSPYRHTPFAARVLSAGLINRWADRTRGVELFPAGRGQEI